MRSVASGHSVHMIVELSLDLTHFFTVNSESTTPCACCNVDAVITKDYIILCAEAVDKGVGRRNFDGLSQVMHFQVKLNVPTSSLHSIW